MLDQKDTEMEISLDILRDDVATKEAQRKVTFANSLKIPKGFKISGGACTGDG